MLNLTGDSIGQITPTSYCSADSIKMAGSSFLLFVYIVCAAIIVICAFPAPEAIISATSIEHRAPQGDQTKIKHEVQETSSSTAAASNTLVSFTTVLTGIEDSLFQVASAASVIDSPARVYGVNQSQSPDHLVAKRENEENDKKVTLDSSAVVVLQTTERVPRFEGVPAHILIDRISVQPFIGGLPQIPTFQVRHSKLNDEGVNFLKANTSLTERNDTTLQTTSESAILKSTTIATLTNTDSAAQSTTIATTDETNKKMHITNDTHADNLKSINTSSTTIPSTLAVSSSATTPTSTSPLVTTTVNPETSSTTAPSTITPSTSSITVSTANSTSKPVEELKEAELELKEKVAEIEAEPIILSSRV